MNTPTIRPKLTMSKMSVKKKEVPIVTSSFDRRKLNYYCQLWNGLATFRKESERAAKYFNGDQWHEKIRNKSGQWVREDEYIISQGKIPLKQNKIKPIIRTLEGQFRTDTSKSVVVSRTPEKGKESEMLSNALQYSLTSINNSRDLDARVLEEYLISGLAVQRISYEYIPELKKKDVLIRNQNRNVMFWNGDIEDIRGYDVRVIGRMIDCTIDELLVNLGSTPERCAELKKIYSLASLEYYTTIDANNPELFYNKNFYLPLDNSKCRVIEVWEKRLVEQMCIHDWMDGIEFYADWTKSQLKAANDLRISKYASDGVAPEDVPIMEGTQENVMKWFFTYYSPYGHILREGESPFEHGSHPFVTLFYPLLDGKITGLATDLIDAQRQVNRLLIMNEMILSSSVKNTLVISQEAMDGKTKDEIGDEYKEIGGVVVVKPGPSGRIGESVMEMKGSVGNMGVSEMIQLYIRMLEDVSGVYPAMQGQQAQSGTSGKLYDAQIMQSTLNSKDVMDTFTGLFRKNRDMKVLQTIQQYYTEPIMIAISGKGYLETAQLYDPEKVKDIQYDTVIGQTADSPVYRAVIEDSLNNMLFKGLIDLQIFLENTTMPYSQQMLESIRKRTEQAQSNPQAAVQGLAQDAQQAGVGGDQQVVDAVHQVIKQ